MDNIITYDFGKYLLEFNRETGKTVTRYSHGPWSGCLPVPDDAFHAEKLGITAKQHRLEHELCHHLVGQSFYKTIGSPVIWNDAHHYEQKHPDAMLEEWMVTAFQYSIHEKPADAGAFVDMEKAGIDVCKLQKIATWLLEAPEHISLIKLNF
jgi:hypothetical protein